MTDSAMRNYFIVPPVLGAARWLPAAILSRPPPSYNPHVIPGCAVFPRKGGQEGHKMSSADQYRTFARECIRWEHREAFMDMATHWAAAAARLDHQQALFDRFEDLVQDAKRASVLSRKFADKVTRVSEGLSRQ
jgi:hypothetical protein